MRLQRTSIALALVASMNCAVQADMPADIKACILDAVAQASPMLGGGQVTNSRASAGLTPAQAAALLVAPYSDALAAARAFEAFNAVRPLLMEKVKNSYMTGHNRRALHELSSGVATQLADILLAELDVTTAGQTASLQYLCFRVHGRAFVTPLRMSR